MHYWLSEPDLEGLYDAKVIGVDTETISLKDRSLLGIGVAFEDNAVYATPDDELFNPIIRVVQDIKVNKIYQNAPFDLRVLREYDPDTYSIDDTAVMGRLCGFDSVVLEDLSSVLEVHTESVKNFLERFGIKEMDKAPPEEVALKCCNDALVTLKLKDWLAPQMLVPQVYYRREMMIVHQLDVMSRKGIAIDQELRGELEAAYTQQYTIFKYKGEAEYGLNLGSPKQVATVFSHMPIFLPLNKSQRSLGTGKEILETLDHPLAALVLDYRHVQKMLGTYLNKLRGQERAYTTLHMDAVTGRISSTSAGDNNPDLNMQNIPRKVEKGEFPPVRSIFIPDSDMFTRFDLSQIELRTLAFISGDETMQGILNDPKQDLHSSTAIGMFGSAEKKHRDNAKTFNFAMIYGDTPSALARKLRVSLEDTQAMFAKWGDTFPVASAWIKERREESHNYPYAETLYGRKIPLPTEYEWHMENCAVNYVIQGSAAEVFKRIMLELNHLLPEARLQIHDEMIYDGYVEIPEKELSMIAGFWTPLDLERLDRWGVVKEA